MPLVLVVDHKIPEPNRDAGSRSTAHLLRGLVSEGFAVTFWPTDMRFRSCYADQLVASGVDLLAQDGRIYSIDELRSWLKEHQGSSAWVFLSRPSSAELFLSVSQDISGFRFAYYGHDLHHRRLEREAKNKFSDLDLLDLADQMYQKETQIWSQMDLIYYPAIDEVFEVRGWLDEHSINIPVRQLPVFSYTMSQLAETTMQPQQPEGQRLLFVAGYAHRPNIDAALWFIREAWPLVQFRHPSAELWLVGSYPPPEIEASASTTIRVTGAVSDVVLDDLYRSSRVAIAPIRYGAGVNGKVVEAMRYGLPCVCTPEAARGFDDYGAALRIAAKPQDFARACRELLTQDELWQIQSIASIEYVRNHFSEQSLQDALKSMLT